MTYYQIVEPFSGEDTTPVFCILSEDEIVKEYGTYCCLMYLCHLGYIPTRTEIVDEWAVIHWATELKGEIRYGVPHC